MIARQYRAEWEQRGGMPRLPIVPCSCGNDCPEFRTVLSDGRWVHWPDPA